MAPVKEVIVCEPDDFTLLKVVGEGAFARQVALARNASTNNLCVIKTLDKGNLIRRKQVVHTITEKRVLQQLTDHPFIVKLYDAFQTPDDLHFVLEWCQGGELFYHIQRIERFTQDQTRFFTAEILCALEHIHASHIVYRDLKPENVLLDAQGHVRLADFGFAKDKMDQPSKRTFSFCGSPQYLSPEMVLRQGHTIATDLWAFGCLCYELLTGRPPFPESRNSDYSLLFQQICNGEPEYPDYLSPDAVSLLKKLLAKDPRDRLTVREAKEHAFFQTIDWNDVMQRKLQPPIVTNVKEAENTDNFDGEFTCRSPLPVLTPSSKRLKRMSHQSIDPFKDF